MRVSPALHPPEMPPPLATSLLGHASQHALPRGQGARRKVGTTQPAAGQHPNCLYSCYLIHQTAVPGTYPTFSYCRSSQYFDLQYWKHSRVLAVASTSNSRSTLGVWRTRYAGSICADYLIFTNTQVRSKQRTNTAEKQYTLITRKLYYQLKYTTNLIVPAYPQTNRENKDACWAAIPGDPTPHALFF